MTHDIVPIVGTPNTAQDRETPQGSLLLEIPLVRILLGGPGELSNKLLFSHTGHLITQVIPVINLLMIPPDSPSSTWGYVGGKPRIWKRPDDGDTLESFPSFVAVEYM